MIAPGTRLADRYRVESVLGQGGMGAVYVAHDEKFGVRVALKVTEPAGGQLEQLKGRFVREARVGNLLGKAAGFVRAFDWGELPGGFLYMTMDLVEKAKSLDLKSGSLSERLARLREAARLVGLAHKSGVLHRDLKPANFLQAADGTIWLADFGLAKFRGDSAPEPEVQISLTGAGEGMGTPGFMPPEQFDAAKTADERADVYALGTMLFFALTQKMPFEGGLTQVLTRQMLVSEGTAPLPRPRSIVPDVPAALDELCARSIAMERDQRLASADELIRGIDAFLESTKKRSSGSVATGVLTTPRASSGGVTTPRASMDAETQGATIIEPPPPGSTDSIAPRRHSTSSGGSRKAVLLAVPVLLVGGLAIAFVAKSEKTEPTVVAGAPTPTPASSALAPTPSPAASPSPTPTPAPTPTPTPAPTPTPTPAPTPTPTPAPSPTAHAAPVETPAPPAPSPVAVTPATSSTTRPPTPEAEPTKASPPATPSETAPSSLPKNLRKGDVRTIGRLSVQLYEYKLPYRVDGAVAEMEMVYVPPGPFVMGIVPREGREGKRETAAPQHLHPLKGYWIGLVDVTREQYEAFCEQASHPSAPRPEWWTADMKSPGQHPITNVSWNDAKAYCDWAHLQLPTEPEWEKAARGAQDKRRHPWGEWPKGEPSKGWLNFCDVSCPPTATNLRKAPCGGDEHQAGWRDTTSNDGYAYTSPVGSFPDGVSPFGCLDMAGNVNQWCEDEYEESAYEKYAKGVFDLPKGDGTRRMARGGSWVSAGNDCQTVTRHWYNSTLKASIVGFRVVLDPER